MIQSPIQRIEISGNVSLDDIIIEPGLAKAVHPTEKGKPYYQWLETGARDYQTALRERIALPMQNGMLVGKFDDRKYRLDSARKDASSNKWIVRIGPTHFGEMEATAFSLASDAERFADLIRAGAETFEDPFAYFAKGIAVNAVPVTSDGYAHVFKRGPKVKRPGWWHDLGGMLDSDLSIFEKPDPSAEFRERLKRVLLGEFKEEMGAGNVDLIFTGLAYDALATADFTFIANIPVTSSEFIAGRGLASGGDENDNVLPLKSKQEVRDFLKSPRQICYTGRAALELYLSCG